MYCRNVDPTTALLQRIHTLEHGITGVLAVDSHSISLLQSDTDSISTLLSLDLVGLPTALKHLQGCAWALADSMAGLYIISLAQQCSLQKLTAEIPLSVANMLCHVPNPTAGEGDA